MYIILTYATCVLLVAIASSAMFGLLCGRGYRSRSSQERGQDVVQGRPTGKNWEGVRLSSRRDPVCTRGVCVLVQRSRNRLRVSFGRVSCR